MRLLQKKTILVVEDDEAIRTGLVDHLADGGFEVLEATDGASALDLALETDPDLVILDVVLPDLSGFDVCSRLRDRGTTVPIVMLTARDLEEDKIRGFDHGADDYVTKPFGIQELLARVRAHLRRAGGWEEKEPGKVHIGEAVVDLEAWKIHLQGEEYPLSPLERKILTLLIERRGKPVTRDDFLSRIWGIEAANTRTVDFHIFRLRRKLEPDPNEPQYLKTVHGQGYRLEE
jgi:two-component system phosphate regulon response regulator PhoB/two-component system alkaline phosphatase synthesis response regulator PhoP